MNEVRESAARGGEAPGRRVLLVGGEVGPLASIARKLSPRIGRLVEAVGPEEALRALRSEPFDLIIADRALAELLASCAPERSALPESLPSLERRHILETLDRVGWNRRRAAKLLQISTTTLWRRLKAFGVVDRNGPSKGWAGGVRARPDSGAGACRG